jgi:hypothetical protein
VWNIETLAVTLVITAPAGNADASNSIVLGLPLSGPIATGKAGVGAETAGIFAVVEPPEVYDTFNVAPSIAPASILNKSSTSNVQIPDGSEPLNAPSGLYGK